MSNTAKGALPVMLYIKKSDLPDPQLIIDSFPVSIVGESGATLEIDPLIGGLTVVESVHTEVHEGHMFSSEHSASVNNNANLDIRIKTGAKYCHTTFSVNAGGACAVYLYEAASISVGTALTEYNMNRNSDNLATAQLFHTPTVSGVGTTPIVNGRLLPGGNSPTTRIGGASRQNIEYVLKLNTEYLLRATNVSGGTISINSVVEWYEED